MSPSPRSPIVIFGAGSVGCYLGGRLAATQTPVCFIGRQRVADAIAAQGLRVSSLDGTDLAVPASAYRFETRAEAVADAGLVLVTVKSAATEAVAEQLRPHLPAAVPVISFQNGIHNAGMLQASLPDNPVLAGMVPYNVVQLAPGHVHQGSAGGLEVAASPHLSPWLAAFERAGLALSLQQQMLRVLWGKLLLNLNNPINALSGLPLKAQLSLRSYRRCLALAQREALAWYARAGIRPARVTAVPPQWLPGLLDTPDGLFVRAARRMLAMDPLARSSMWEDLQAGRPTEIDWINGEVVRLAESLGGQAPVNQQLVALIRAAEQGQSQPWSGEALLARLQAAPSSAG